MKALITGIAGFAGNYLAQLLLSKGIEVYGLSQEVEFRPFLAIDRAAVHYRAQDIADRQRIEDLVRDIRPDFVFHLAARSSPSASVSEPVRTFEVNFQGTVNLLESLRLAGARCRFLIVSSSHVYGDVSEPGLVTEAAQLKPSTPYAASKAAAEMAAYQYWKSYGIEAIIARPFNHTGAGQNEGFVCPDLARKVVEIERGLQSPKLVVSNPLQQIDFSNVRDIVRGYYSALVTGAPGRAYNLCSGEAVAVGAVAELLVSQSSRPVELDLRARVGRSKRGIIGDNSRARRELGWQPEVPFAETVREVLEYSRQSYKASTLPQECGNFQATHDVYR